QKHTGVSYGIMCLAEGGKNFKGQRNRDWVTVPGNVHLSTYLNPAQKVEHFNLGFAILPVISILQAIDAFDGLHNKAAITWVNDVLIDEAKIAGALTQTQVSGDTVTSFISGIGVNIETKPPAVPDLVVANADCVNSFVSPYQKISQHAFLKEFLTKFSANYQHLLSGGYDDLLNVYRQRSALVGRKVTVLSDPLNDRSEKVTEGIVQSIGENLELFLENHNHPVIRGRVVLN
ncbi:MAG: biotin--[acetyl-CoA-carboxylase] ligase, partial [Calditrichaeota bacterium]